MTEMKQLAKRVKELENQNKLLGERCNQLLKDKGELTDKLDNQTVAYETLKLHDQEEIGMLNSKVADLENKIADIKANCDLAIEGRDVKIKELELELTVEKDLHQEETNLHLHAEKYIKSLEQQIEKAVEIIRDLGSTVREGVTCHYLVDNGGLHRATLFLKEIKENEKK